MQKLVKNGAVVSDDWQFVEQGGDIPAAGKILINVSDWTAELGDRELAIWLNSDQAPSLIDEGVLAAIPMIAINFPAFADGRGYSYAYILRKELGFTGELRAIGDVLRDQMFYMKRVGFDSFAVREDRDAQDAVASLNDFSHSYQASADQATPLIVSRWK